jgi:hypothetical protein
MKQDRIDEAKGYFNQVLVIKSDYPNAHYGLAHIAEMEHDLKSALNSCISTLKGCKIKDDLYKQAVNLTVRVAKSQIESNTGERIFSEYLHKLEFEGGLEIKATIDNSITTAAKIEFAENYNRDYHIIRYKTQYPAKEHLMMHELVHLHFVIEAQKQGVNKLFVSNQNHKRQFSAKEADWIKKLRLLKLSEESITTVVTSIFEGLNSQIYNAPIDLFIEDLLYNEFPDLRPYQFISMYAVMSEAVHAVTDKKIVELTSKSVLYSSKIYNIVSALHFKNLFGVDFIPDLQTTQQELRVATKMYEEFLEYRYDRTAGEEYELLQNWADDLKLNNYFELADELTYRKKRNNINTILAEIENDPFDLESDNSDKKREEKKFLQSQQEIGTNMAVVMFMVDAMDHFKHLPVSEIHKIAYEIAMIGIHGIKPESTGFKVSLIPDKTFSGYHLLAYYYVSWAIAIPHDLESLGLPYKNEYEMAKTIFNKEK